MWYPVDSAVVLGNDVEDMGPVAREIIGPFWLSGLLRARPTPGGQTSFWAQSCDQTFRTEKNFRRDKKRVPDPESKIKHCSLPTECLLMSLVGVKNFVLAIRLGY